MNKKFTLVAAAIAILFVSLSNCASKKSDDSGKNFAIFYLLDQLSGNCATITKNSAGTVYSALGSAVPKGGCKAGTLNTGLYTTDPSVAATAVGTGYDALKAVYDANSSTCSANSTAMTNAKSGVTTASLTTVQSALTSGINGCSFAGYRLDSGKISSVFICKDTASITAISALTSYFATSSVTADMSVNLADKKTYQTSITGVTGFTASAIAAMKPYGADVLTVVSGVNYTAYAVAALSNTTCSKAIVASDSTLKSTLNSLGGGGYSLAAGITTADGATVTAVVTSSLGCGYGSAFTATTSSSFGTAAGTCPASYPVF